MFPWKPSGETCPPHAYTQTCTCIHTHRRAPTLAHRGAYTVTCTHTGLHTQTHAHRPAHTNMCTHTGVHTKHMCTHTQVCTHKHVHTHAHRPAHTNTHTRPKPHKRWRYQTMRQAAGESSARHAVLWSWLCGGGAGRAAVRGCGFDSGRRKGTSKRNAGGVCALGWLPLHQTLVKGRGEF